jgi:hypothetical protein
MGYRILSFVKTIAKEIQYTPTTTLLYVLKSFLSELIHEKSKGMKSKFLQEKDLKDTQILEIQVFLRKLNSFLVLLELKDSLLQLLDLSFLWNKETFLSLQKNNIASIFLLNN